MPLQPAFETVLRHGTHAVTLRASLRAAVSLDNLPGGIPGAWDSLMRQSYSGIRAVILATATDKAAAAFLLSSLSDKPLAPFLGPAQAACITILHNLLPPAPEAAESRAKGDTMPLRDYLELLFKFGTGEMRWLPAEVWQCSVAELHAILMLRHPPEQPDARAKDYSTETLARLHDPNNTDPDPTFDRQSLRALKARHNA